MNSKFLTLMIVLMLTALLLGACVKPTPSGSGQPNPASVNCEEKGGKVDIRTAEDGSQSGVCVFEDGSECDEWALYRGECSPKSSEVKDSVPGMANPASVNCEEKGGKVEMHTDADGSQYGMCVFPGGGECEEWAFFRGECTIGPSE